MNNKITAARRAGRVVRYHTYDLVRPENVAHHTFNVMNLLMIMTQGAVSKNLLVYALLHDQGEYVTGDIPSPIKKSMDPSSKCAIDAMEVAAININHHCGLPELTEWEYTLFKTADNLDGLIKCKEEVRLGNHELGQAANTYCVYLRKLAGTLNGGPAYDLIMGHIDEWEAL